MKYQTLNKEEKEIQMPLPAFFQSLAVKGAIYPNGSIIYILTTQDNYTSILKCQSIEPGIVDMFIRGDEITEEQFNTSLDEAIQYIRAPQINYALMPF